MKKVMVTIFAGLGVASLIFGSKVTKEKFHSGRSIILTIQDTVPKPDSPTSMHKAKFISDTVPKPDSPRHTNLVVLK